MDIVLDVVGGVFVVCVGVDGTVLVLVDFVVFIVVFYCCCDMDIVFLDVSGVFVVRVGVDCIVLVDVDVFVVVFIVVVFTGSLASCTCSIYMHSFILQSTKMILKFRENHIAKLERMRKREREGEENEEDDKDKEIVSQKRILDYL